jgi:hypothetical protein
MDRNGGAGMPGLPFRDIPTAPIAHRHGKQMNSTPDTSTYRTVAFLLAFFAAALLLTGCGDFWQAPGSTGTSTGTTATTTTLTPSTSTPVVGSAIILTATVSPDAATGTVTFYNNSASIGSQTLDSGTATLSTTFTTAGTESLTASYGGSDTYASSTSSAVSVTVSAASSTGDQKPVAAAAHVVTTALTSAAIHAIEPFRAAGGSFTAQDAAAVVVEGSGSVSLNGTALSSAAGEGRGVLLEGSTSATNAMANAAANTADNVAANAADVARFSMVGGSLTYDCGAAEAALCAAGPSGANAPATVFSVAGTTAEIALTDVAMTNNTATKNHAAGTLLTTAALGDGQHVQFTAVGTAVAGDVVATGAGDVTLRLLQDEAGRGSSLTGAINSEHAGRSVSLALDAGSVWTVTGTSYLTALSGLDVAGRTVNNIDGGGHCVFYSGAVNGSSSRATYTLSGGGFLAPLGTTGLNCD